MWSRGSVICGRLALWQVKCISTTPDSKRCKFSGCAFMLVISTLIIFSKEHAEWRSSLVTWVVSLGWLLWTGRQGIGGSSVSCARCQLWVSKAARGLEEEWVEGKAFPAPHFLLAGSGVQVSPLCCSVSWLAAAGGLRWSADCGLPCLWLFKGTLVFPCPSSFWSKEVQVCCFTGLL